MTLVQRTFSLPNGVSSCECWIFIIEAEDGLKHFWFKGKDVATFLGYKYPRDALIFHVPEEWRMCWDDLKGKNSLHSLEVPTNWQPHTVFIHEKGLFQLITKSKKPEAEHLQKWVNGEILPALRRGSIVSDEKLQEIVQNQMDTFFKQRTEEEANRITQLMNDNNLFKEKFEEKDNQMTQLLGENTQLLGENRQLLGDNRQLMERIDKKQDDIRQLMERLDRKDEDYRQLTVDNRLMLENVTDFFSRVQDRFTAIPQNASKRHAFCLMKTNNEEFDEYVFVRRQKGDMANVIRDLERRGCTMLLYKDNEPNPVNLLPIIKEKLRSQEIEYRSLHNRLLVNRNSVNIVSMVEHLLNRSLIPELRMITTD